MKTKGIALVLAAAVAGLLLLLPAAAQPLPKYYGVFAESGGKWIELKRNPHSDNYYNPLGGADIIRLFSGITFPSRPTRFIIFSPMAGAVGMEGVRVNVLSRIGNEKQPAYHVSEWGSTYHIAPVPGQPQMVELVGDASTVGGHMAVIFNGFYDFEVLGGSDSGHACVMRIVAITGPSFQPC